MTTKIFFSFLFSFIDRSVFLWNYVNILTDGSICMQPCSNYSFMFEKPELVLLGNIKGTFHNSDINVIIIHGRIQQVTELKVLKFFDLNAIELIQGIKKVKYLIALSVECQSFSNTYNDVSNVIFPKSKSSFFQIRNQKR